MEGILGGTVLYSTMSLSDSPIAALPEAHVFGVWPHVGSIITYEDSRICSTGPVSHLGTWQVVKLTYDIAPKEVWHLGIYNSLNRYRQTIS